MCAYWGLVSNSDDSFIVNIPLVFIIYLFYQIFLMVFCSVIMSYIFYHHSYHSSPVYAKSDFSILYYYSLFCFYFTLLISRLLVSSVSSAVKIRRYVLTFFHFMRYHLNRFFLTSLSFNV